MTIEICAYSLESCINAQAGGAGRVELCSGLGEGGTTPSAGLIEIVRKNIDIQLYVMIRPRGGDFVYDFFEEEIMRKDIDLAKKLGANGVVLGILTPDGHVDVARTKALVDYAAPLKSHFPPRIRPHPRSDEGAQRRDCHRCRAYSHIRAEASGHSGDGTAKQARQRSRWQDRNYGRRWRKPSQCGGIKSSRRAFTAFDGEEIPARTAEVFP